MHCGNIDEKSNSAAARVYRILQEYNGGWVDGMTLTLRARTTAVSTRISEIRHQIKPPEVIDVMRTGRGFSYRLRNNVTSLC